MVHAITSVVFFTSYFLCLSEKRDEVLPDMHEIVTLNLHSSSGTRQDVNASVVYASCVCQL